MDITHAVIFAVGAGLALGGARLIWCGHKSIRAGRHDRRGTPDRRSRDRRPDRRQLQ